MSFCSFSKEFLTASFTSVENQFITKYMPQSDGLPVKVYLYGLYLCQSGSELDLEQLSSLLLSDVETVKNAFYFWEDYDLIRVISKEPFSVEYLPVSNAIGRPKKVRYDKYGDFNKELQNKMQKVGKFISYNESIKYMNFLQDNTIELDAFLLIAQYCIDKKQDKVTQNYILNKAKKFISQNLITFHDVEKELSGFNIHEEELISVFSALGTFKAPEEGDYTLFDKWTNTYLFSLESIKAAAKTIKKGNMDILDRLLTEIHQAGKQSDAEVKAYLEESELLTSLTFTIARKLSVKINSPQTYIEEYVEKWYNYGYDETALSAIAVYCTKLSHNSFLEMDSLIEELYQRSIISDDAVDGYLSEKNKEIKLLVKIKAICPSVRITSSSLSIIKTWHDWNFSDTMILEAAKRSTETVSAIPYMNKILSDWKHKNIFSVSDIPENAPLFEQKKEINKNIQALDDRAEREKYYAGLRRQAESIAEAYENRAKQNSEFEKVTSELSTFNIQLAKAKVFEPDKVSALQDKILLLRSRRKQILFDLDISESDLIPHYHCQKCNDTGFCENGKACDCYKNRA